MELEVINEPMRLEDDSLEMVKGGFNDGTAVEEKCCDIQFSCNYKGKSDSPEDPVSPQTLYVH